MGRVAVVTRVAEREVAAELEAPGALRGAGTTAADAVEDLAEEMEREPPGQGPPEEVGSAEEEPREVQQRVR